MEIMNKDLENISLSLLDEYNYIKKNIILWKNLKNTQSKMIVRLQHFLIEDILKLSDKAMDCLRGLNIVTIRELIRLTDFPIKDDDIKKEITLELANYCLNTECGLYYDMEKTEDKKNIGHYEQILRRTDLLDKKMCGSINNVLDKLHEIDLRITGFETKLKRCKTKT
jgi:hypothetical protein